MAAEGPIQTVDSDNGVRSVVYCGIYGLWHVSLNRGTPRNSVYVMHVWKYMKISKKTTQVCIGLTHKMATMYMQSTAEQHTKDKKLCRFAIKDKINCFVYRSYERNIAVYMFIYLAWQLVKLLMRKKNDVKW